MPRLLCYLSITILIVGCSGKTFDTKLFYSFPKHAEILEEFEKKYSMPEGSYIELRKDPEGYWVVEKDYEKRKETGKNLFWSMKEKRFMPLPSKYSKNGMDYGSGNLRYSQYEFDHNLYFGYAEAYDESIAVLDGVEDLDDTLCEALARALSSKSTSLMGNMSAGEKRVLLNEQNKAEYIDLANRSLKVYEKIRSRNPDYEVLVGDVGTKIAHDHLNYWWNLDQSGMAEDGKKFLKKDLYSSTLLNLARNMMNSCPKNAVLFTWGDSDTFPLLYLQEAEGFRKDIAIINTSMANLPDHITYLKKKYGLKTTLSEKEYNDPALNVVLISREPEKTHSSITISSFLEGIVEKEHYFRKDYNGKDYAMLPSASLELPIEGDESDTNSVQLINFDLSRASYLFTSELFQLDLMNNHWKDRAICYAGSGENPVMKGCSNIVMRGITYQIIKTKINGPVNMVCGKTDLSASRELLLKTYTYKAGGQEYKRLYRIYSNYLYSAFETGNGYLSTGDTSQAIRIIDDIRKEIPMEKLPETFSLKLSFANLYRNANAHHKISELMKMAFDEIDQMILKKDDYEIERMRDMFRSGYIEQLTAASGDKQLQNRYEQLRKQIQLEEDPIGIPAPLN